MASSFGTPKSLAKSVRKALGHRDNAAAKPFAPSARPQGLLGKVQAGLKPIKPVKAPKLPVVTPAVDNPEDPDDTARSLTKAPAPGQPDPGSTKPKKPKLGGQVHNIRNKAKPASSATIARRTVNYNRAAKPIKPASLKPR